MKIAICIATGGVDNYGYLRRYAERVAQVAHIRGLDVEILRYPESDFYPRLLANLADKNCIVHFYGYVCDPNIPAPGVDGVGFNAFDSSQATIVATIGDHPFSTFMRPTMQNAHPRTKFIVMDRAFQDEMEILNPDLADACCVHQPISPPTNYDEHRVKDFESRSFDLVIPMFITDMTDYDINSILSSISADWFVKVISATYEQSLADQDESPFHIFQQCFQKHLGLSLAQVRDQNPAIFGQITTMMAAVDGVVRQQRRQNMVRGLLQSVGNLKVAITCNPVPGMDVDKKVQFLGECSVTDVSCLMADARAVFNSNPSYPSSLHERVVSGMMYESCVITDVNPCIATTFTDDEYVGYETDKMATISDIYEGYDIRSIAAAGAQKVRSDYKYTWNGHIDRVVRAAAG